MGLQRLREFFWSETQLCGAVLLNLWSQNTKYSKNQKEVLQLFKHFSKNLDLHPQVRKNATKVGLSKQELPSATLFL